MGQKIIAILFSAIIINASTELHQLIRIPFLIQHFSHHQKEDASLSFIAFLKIHYTDKDHPNDNDDKEDNELPFKSTGSITHIDTPLIDKKFTSSTNYYNIEKPVAYYPEGSPNHRAFSIFHPPRTA